jgi:hypothetical protein
MSWMDYIYTAPPNVQHINVKMIGGGGGCGGAGQIEVIEYMGLMNKPYSGAIDIDQRIADLEGKRDQLQERIRRLKECREVYDTLPFKEGDVAFHKDHGTVLVRNIEFGAPESDFQDIKYTVVNINAQTIKVPYKELVENTPAAKALFAKKPGE